MNFTSQRIITSTDLKIVRGSDGNTFKKRLSYQFKTGKLIKIRRWIYSIGDQIDTLGLPDYMKIANSIYTPSYISFETVAKAHGSIFQSYESIFLASKYTKDITVDISDGQSLYIHYVMLPKALLTCTTGLEQRDGYTIASFERAFCDILRRNPNYYFDKLDKDMFSITTLKDILYIYEQFKPWFQQLVLSTLKKYGITMAIWA